MKQLTCEMCGSTDLLKQEGVFVCQICGTKYSVEEAKKMMIEGTVEVKGTIQVDKSNELEKLMTIARRARDEGNDADAAAAFSQALAIDPQNWEANLYRGYCNMMCSKVINMISNFQTFCNVGTSSVIMANALENPQERLNAHKIILNEMFAVAQLVVANAYSSYNNRNIRTTVEEYNWKDEVNSRTDDFGEFCLTLSQALQALLNTYVFEDDTILYEKKNFSEQYEIAKHIQTLTGKFFNAFITPSFNQPRIGNSLQYSGSTVSDLFKKTNSVFLSNFMDLKNTLNNIYSDVGSIVANKRKCMEDQKAKEQKERNEKYWAEHAEEKNHLESERKELQEKMKQLQDQLVPYEREISDWKKKREADTPACAEKAKVQEQISALRQQQSSLGLFKGKEKKALQSQIDELNSRLPAINESIEAEEKEQAKICNGKIREIEQTMLPIKEQIAAVQKRINEINTELTKNR